MNQGITTTVEERALKFLGSGASAEQTASALGVTAGRISQLLSDSHFASQVADLKCAALMEQTGRDQKLDTLEDKLVSKIEDLMPMIMRPMEAIRSFQIINAAKRRAAILADHTTVSANIVQISMPQTVINRFTTNIHNQVVQAGGQDLLTIQSGALLKQVQDANPQLATLNQALPAVIGEKSNELLRQGIEQSSRDRDGIAATSSQQAESRQPVAINFIPVGG